MDQYRAFTEDLEEDHPFRQVQGIETWHKIERVNQRNKRVWLSMQTYESLEEAQKVVDKKNKELLKTVT